jgi:hypothetical protein
MRFFFNYRCEVILNYCASNPCAPNGNCVNGDTGYTCTCFVVCFNYETIKSFFY